MTDILAKELLPTELDTRGIRERISAEIRRRSFFSAKVGEARILNQLRALCQRYADGTINIGDFTGRMQRYLDSIGYVSEGDGLKDLATERRLQLIARTQKRMADSFGRVASQTASQVRRYPAWRLGRTGSRTKAREDWAARWNAAGEACAWQGACRVDFVALKSSPIWAELGAGAGGFRDTIGNPYPPFAFGSGMGWLRVSADECRRLGLLPEEAEVPALPDFAPTTGEIADAERELAGFELEI